MLLRRVGRAEPWVRIEEWPYAVEQPVAPALAAELAAVDTVRGLDDAALLARHWVLAPDVAEETTGEPGAGDPQHIVVRQQRGFRRAVEVDTALAGVLGACDGELGLDRIVASVAGLLEVDPALLAAEVVPRTRVLVVDGLLR